VVLQHNLRDLPNTGKNKLKEEVFFVTLSK
jgi:hypothetical protein